MAKKRGRPTKFKPEYAEQVYKLCLLGATDEQIAEFFGVAVSTVYLWAEKQRAFSEARKNGKLAADANVAEALYRRALGYTHPEEKIFQYEGDPVRVETLKHYPPDTAAAFIWLKNRAGWRDKQDVEVAGAGGGPVAITVTRRVVHANNRVAAALRADGSNGNGSHP